MWRRIRVTKPARSLLDLAAVLPAGRVEDALDRALTRRLTTIAGVEQILSEVKTQRPGARVLAAIISERALGRVPAVYHHVVRDADGRFLAEVDFAYPELKLAIEVDGWAVHGTPGAMGRDFVRQNGLVAYGWHVLRFTWRQVVQEPAAVAASIAATLAALATAA